MNNECISPNARNFLRLIRLGKIPLDILPNNSPNYTSMQERCDTDYYTNLFLNSSVYDFVRDEGEVHYDGE